MPSVEQFIKDIAVPESGSITWCAPSASGNRLLFGACDKYLYCLDKNTGKVLWKFLTGGAIFSEANIVKDRIFFTSEDKYVYCISLKAGEVIWKKLFPAWPMNSPTFADGVLYFGCNDNNLYAISADDGKILWNFRTGGIVLCPPAIINDSVYFGSFDKNFYSLDIDGRQKWRFLTGGYIDWPVGIADSKGNQAWSILDRNSNRTVLDGSLYFGSFDNYLYALSLDGDFRWKFLAGNHIGCPPAICEGGLYFGSRDRNFYSVDAKTGLMKWRFVTGGFIDTPAFIFNGIAYFGCHDQNLYALALDGTQAWRFLTGGPVLSPPIVINGVLYFGSADTFLYAIRLRDKKIFWKFQTGMPAAPFRQLLKDFVETVGAQKQPFTFINWKPEALKKSYGWNIEVGHLVTAPYKSENPYMNKPVYRMDSPYRTEQKRKKEPWER